MQFSFASDLLFWIEMFCVRCIFKEVKSLGEGKLRVENESNVKVIKLMTNMIMSHASPYELNDEI